MKKVIMFAIFASILFTSVYAKGSGEDGSISIGANLYSYADNFMQTMRPELEAYPERKGVSITLLDSEGDQAKLNDQVDTFISKGVDALAINLVDPAAARTIIEKAKAANLPLILFNKEATEEGVMQIYDKVWYVGTNSAESGIIQGEMMLSDWKDHSEWDKNNDGIVQYVMLKGEPGHPDAEARTTESVKVFTDAGIQVEELALTASPQWSTSDANNTMESWLTSAFAKDIELVIANNDAMAFGAVQAMKSAGVAIPTYGVDALAQAISMVADGDLTGTVLQDGPSQSRAIIDFAVNAVKGKDVTEGTGLTLENKETKAVRIPYQPVSQNTVKNFQ